MNRAGDAGTFLPARRKPKAERSTPATKIGTQAPIAQTTPMQAVSQMQAAVVKPRTRISSVLLRTMTPPPRNPMPVISPWMVRLLASQCADTVGAKPSVAITISAEPRQTSPSVRMPVGLPCRSRLRPITAPIRVAAVSRRTISYSSIMAVLALARRLTRRSS